MINNKNLISELLEFSIINIDKPSGPTSFQISDFVKKQLGLRKTSHFGTLDPKVTGVLPIALNRACKLTGFFLGHDKEYVGVMRVHKNISLKKLQRLIDEKFIGKIKQVPPKRSRVKRQEREREIMKFEILEKKGKDFLFHTEVQGGTYIRKLVNDLGLEVGGAHMTELRRTRAGIFSEQDKNFINLYDLKKYASDEKKLKEILIPAEQAIKKIFPVMQVKKEAVEKLLTGKPLIDKDILGELPKEERFAVFQGEKFIGIYKKADISEKERDIIARPEFVLQPIDNKNKEKDF